MVGIQLIVSKHEHALVFYEPFFLHKFLLHSQPECYLASCVHPLELCVPFVSRPWCASPRAPSRSLPTPQAMLLRFLARWLTPLQVAPCSVPSHSLLRALLPVLPARSLRRSRHSARPRRLLWVPARRLAARRCVWLTTSSTRQVRRLLCLHTHLTHRIYFALLTAFPCPLSCPDPLAADMFVRDPQDHEATLIWFGGLGDTAETASNPFEFIQIPVRFGNALSS